MDLLPALSLTGLTLLLVGPAPAALARARWTERAPRAALVLWQAVALAAVLAAFGAGLAIASRLLVPDAQGRPTTSPPAEIEALGAPLWTAYVVVGLLTLLVGARLGFTAVRVAVRTRRRRARHRALVDLLDEASTPALHGRSADLRVLAAAQPLAYCLPGVRARVVVSEGALAALQPEELRAVLAHERAHLGARHDLVLEAFVVLLEAFPRGVRSRSALDAVRLLVELLADDVARGAAGPAPLARALVACAGASTPDAAFTTTTRSTLIRVRRLTHPRRPEPVLSVAVYLAAAAILVVPTLAVAVPWLTEISRLLGA